MQHWNDELLQEHVFNFGRLQADQRAALTTCLNRDFPPAVYRRHVQLRRKALENMAASRTALDGARQSFPCFVNHDRVQFSANDLGGHAIVFTAGGEGERLRLSLLAQGIAPELLSDFTKATYHLSGFPDLFGALQANLAVVSKLSRELGIDIPVVVTTGPEGSITHRVITEVLQRHRNFGLRQVRILAQALRLHLTAEEQIAWKLVGNQPCPVTQPDETGGPIMMLKQKAGTQADSVLDWLESLGCDNILIVQGTALYDRRLLPLMAAALKGHDSLAVGILRTEFPPTDPFGTIVSVSKGNSTEAMIVEQDVRNEATRALKDETGWYHLPLNTGFYGIRTGLLATSDLPDYATPPKEVLPELPRSPKVGYAATDLLPLASNPVVLCIDPSMYGVIKTAADLDSLAELGKRFGLVEICAEVALENRNY